MRPSLGSLLRRDYPSQVFGGFSLLFALGAIGGAVASGSAEGDDRDAAAIFAATFGLFAFGCAFVFVRRLVRIVGLVRRGVVVDGTVCRNEPNSEDVWFLEVDYEFAGTRHRTAKGTGTQSRFAVGDIVHVLVDPQRPDRAWIAE